VIILNDLQGLKSRSCPIVLAAGFFDGLHGGHRNVIQTTLSTAQQVGGEAWVMTFDPHPLKILKPESAPLLLTSTAHKLALLRQERVDGCILLPFTHALAAMPPEAFSTWLFHCAPTLKAVITGGNWRFGSGGKGTPQMLADLGRDMQIRVTTVQPLMHGGLPVSSTRIRKAITCGDLADATAMLGRPPSVLGTVIHGRAIGRTLGYPSANIDPHNEALPPLGVYAVQAVVDGRLHDGALNFGIRPTFDKDKAVPPLLELHLLDFAGNIYAQKIEAFFIERLRDEWYFATVEELKAQIADDIAQTRRILRTHGLTPSQMQSMHRQGL